MQSASAPFPWGTVLALSLIVVSACNPSLSSFLEYNRAGLEAGQLWRVWTGSFVHFGATHAFWNGTVLVAFGSWLERRHPFAVRALYMTAPLALGAVLWFGATSPLVYRGFSGIAAGLVVLGILELFHTHHRPLALLATLLLVGKIALEFSGSSAAQLVNYQVAGVVTWPPAHLTGAIAALTISRRRACFVTEPTELRHRAH